jgi:hypothetical protein
MYAGGAEVLVGEAIKEHRGRRMTSLLDGLEAVGSPVRRVVI